MLTVFTEDHHLHAPRAELSEGRLGAPIEVPARADEVLERIRSTGLGDVIPPQPFDLGPVHRVHDPEFTAFLGSAWSQWLQAGHTCEAIPNVWPVMGPGAESVVPIEASLGRYAFAADTPITEGSWKAARSAVDVALTAQAKIAEGSRAAFALCRPPGHHAGRDYYGGYCFLNNAAIAAQALRDSGAEQVAVLDIDFHHGNGTQSIFYRQADVLFVSLHGDPAEAFPYFWGYAEETGSGPGDGFNVNYPLPRGTGMGAWAEALEDACRRITAYGPEVLVVSLGVDTFVNDPLCFFSLENNDYLRCGGRIARLNTPTLFVMEGGYAIEAIGGNVVNVLQGFAGG